MEHCDFPLGPAWTPESCGPALGALEREGSARVDSRADGPGWTIRPDAGPVTRPGAPARVWSSALDALQSLGRRLSLHPDHLPFRLHLLPATEGRPAAASAEFRCPPWMRGAFLAAVRRRSHALLARIAPPGATPLGEPARTPRPEFPLRSFSVFLSLVLSTCAGIFVMWLFGLALLQADTATPPPDYFGVAHLGELPWASRIRVGWFMAFSMGYPLGFLAGLLCCASEYAAPLPELLASAFLLLAGWQGFMSCVPGVVAPALLAAVALPTLCWLAYGLPWALRQPRCPPPEARA